MTTPTPARTARDLRRVNLLYNRHRKINAQIRELDERITELQERRLQLTIELSACTQDIEDTRAQLVARERT